MITYWKDLSWRDKAVIVKELEDDKITLERVRNGQLCVWCYQTYYNCLCSHDDE